MVAAWLRRVGAVAAAPSLILAASAHADAVAGRRGRSEASPAPGYSKPYEFTADWFSRSVPLWKRILGPLEGRAGLRYLEIGVHEGRSFLWVLENVATHPTSRLTGIDIEVSERLRANVEKSGQAGRVTLIEGPSQVELKALPLGSFDLAYVDGSHAADDVLADAVLSWQVLKEGGLVIFDDYQWDGRHVTGKGPMAAPLVPRRAIDGFMAAYRYEIEVVHRGYQMVLRKKANPCVRAGLKRQCSPFGQYLYDWRGARLLAPGEPPKPVPLSEPERALIESILVSRALDEKARRNGTFEALRTRLDLDLRELAPRPAW